jgi:hypothetical protein
MKAITRIACTPNVAGQIALVFDVAPHGPDAGPCGYDVGPGVDIGDDAAASGAAVIDGATSQDLHSEIAWRGSDDT